MATQNRHYPSSVVEPRSTEAFGDELGGLFNHAGLVLMLSLGHRTGLFESMANGVPGTSQEIATRAGLQERYVRECLGALVTSRVVCYAAEEKLYWLPPEHADLLTGTTENMAALMQWFAVLAGVEDNVVDAFQHGGGVHYHCFHRFHEVMAVESGQTVVSALEDHILPLAPGLSEQLQRGISMLDIGCGSGRAVISLAKAYPGSHFTGYDLCEDAIKSARDLAREEGVENVRFEEHDVSQLEDRDRFDLITGFDVIHDQRDPAAVLDCVAAALKPEGLFLMQDIATSSHLEKNIEHPLGTFLYSISTLHCMTVSLAQGGAGLGTCWGEELALEMLGDAGFGDVRVEKLPHDVQNNYYLCRAQSAGKELS